MSTDRRRDAATAGVGLAGVGGAGALRHSALERAYGQSKRPRIGQELRLLRPGKVAGRGRYLTAAGLSAFAVPPAAVGTARLLHSDPSRRVDKRDRDDKRPSLLREGVKGVRESLHERNQGLREPAPAKLAVGNYLAGIGVGSAAGGLAHLGLGRTKVPGGLRAGLASTAGMAAGSAALPLQSKIISHASHGKYVVTPTGVRRAKTKPVRPSARAATVDARRGDARRNRASIVPSSVGKAAAYYGEDMTHRQKRARIAAVGGAPVIGDVAQAAQAARMAPPSMRGRTAAMQYGGNQAGGLAGNVAGVAAAHTLARHSPAFRRGSEKLSDAADAGAARARRVVGLKPKTGPGMLERVAAHPKVPKAVAKPFLHNPKVAAAGLLVGGAVGGQIGGQAGYGAALSAEDRYKAKLAKGTQSARHGTRVSKVDGANLTVKDKRKLSRRKEHNAAMSMMTGSTGLGSLAALAASKTPGMRPKMRGRLRAVQMPLLTAGAGIGGINSFTGAAIQRKEAQAVAKAGLRLPAVGGVGRRRAPSMRKGYLRQTRGVMGITTTTVRGGLA